MLTGLCPFSDKDPGGLLLLPEKSDLATMNTSEVLAVMNTLLSVAAREVPSDSDPLSSLSAVRNTVMPVTIPSL